MERSTPPAPWVERPTISIDLDAPLEERFGDAPAEVLDSARALLSAIAEEMPARTRHLAYAVRARTANRFHAETAAMARRVQADWRDLTLANISYELILALYGCSTVALPSATGPVLARNMDWWPEALLARSSYLFRYARAATWQFSTAGWPGAVGVVTGMSARGFALALNAVVGSEGIHRTGYPVLLHLRRVLEDAADFADARRMLALQRLTAPALLTLVGRENDQRVVIERTPTRHAERFARDDEALVATNDYRSLVAAQARDSLELYRTTCSRYDALRRFFARHGPDRQVTDRELLYVLSDPAVVQQITAQHVIMRPATEEMRLFVPRRLLGPS